MLFLLLFISCSMQKRAQHQGGIVSLLPSLTETVRALGLGDSLVGVSRYCPRAANSNDRVKVVGDCINPNYEQIVRLRPSLVLIGDMQISSESKFRDLGVPVLTLPQGRLMDVDSAFRIIGRRFSRERAADSIILRLRFELDSLKALHAGVSPVRVLFVVGRNPGTLSNIFTINHTSFLSELLRIAGGVSVFDSMPMAWCKVSVEEILLRDPEVIIETVLMGNNGEGAEIWKRMPQLSAVRSGRIFTLREDYIFTPGPRMAGTAKKLSRILNPDRPAQP
ncbi:MAG: helical backbone metal receptor [Fibrobacterota bacterium]